MEVSHPIRCLFYWSNEQPLIYLNRFKLKHIHTTTQHKLNEFSLMASQGLHSNKRHYTSSRCITYRYDIQFLEKLVIMTPGTQYTSMYKIC